MAAELKLIISSVVVWKRIVGRVDNLTALFYKAGTEITAGSYRLTEGMSGGRVFLPRKWLPRIWIVFTFLLGRTEILSEKVKNGAIEVGGLQGPPGGVLVLNVLFRVLNVVLELTRRTWIISDKCTGVQVTERILTQARLFTAVPWIVTALFDESNTSLERIDGRSGITKEWSIRVSISFSQT